MLGSTTPRRGIFKFDGNRRDRIRLDNSFGAPRNGSDAAKFIPGSMLKPERASFISPEMTVDTATLSSADLRSETSNFPADSFDAYTKNTSSRLPRTPNGIPEAPGTRVVRFNLLAWKTRTGASFPVRERRTISNVMPETDTCADIVLFPRLVTLPRAMSSESLRPGSAVPFGKFISFNELVMN